MKTDLLEIFHNLDEKYYETHTTISGSDKNIFSYSGFSNVYESLINKSKEKFIEKCEYPIKDFKLGIGLKLYRQLQESFDSSSVFKRVEFCNALQLNNLLFELDLNLNDFELGVKLSNTEFKG